MDEHVSVTLMSCKLSLTCSRPVNVDTLMPDCTSFGTICCAISGAKYTQFRTRFNGSFNTSPRLNVMICLSCKNIYKEIDWLLFVLWMRIHVTYRLFNDQIGFVRHHHRWLCVALRYDGDIRFEFLQQFVGLLKIQRCLNGTIVGFHSQWLKRSQSL